LPDLSVRLNDSVTVSGKEGSFAFYSLKPGVYYLTVNTAALGAKKITVPKSPVKVFIENKKKTELKIGVVDAAAIYGEAVIYRPVISRNNISLSGEENKLSEGRGLEGLMIELNNGQQAIKVFTDKDGRFSSEELAPGEWILSVVPESLPQYFYAEQERVSLFLRERDEQKIQVKVFPRIRPVKQFQDGGELKENKKQ